MKPLMRLLREPLVHFLLIGGLLFVLYTAVSDPAPAPVNSIVIAPERVTQLAAAYEAVWRRPPSDDELRALVDNFVREEVYYREALALGLERDDTIIRRRLQQKMEFLTDTGADLVVPSADELEAYYKANEQRFQALPRIAVEQIFLGQSPTPERIAAALFSLQFNTESDPLLWGERTLLPFRMPASTPVDIDGVFGAGFFAALEQLPTGVWAGPVESGYGVHLVRIDDSLPARVPPLEEVREVVLREWKSARATELREQVYTRLRARYEVVLPDSAALNTP
ncbi:MAG: peptidylprolyl isomerase [Gammaproteobacteria bacterium]|jgi:hypothetical protein